MIWWCRWLLRPQWVKLCCISWRECVRVKGPWSFAYVVRRDHVNRAQNADHATRTCEILYYSQNNKIVWLSNMADTLVWEIHEVCKGLWSFFLIVYFRCWLARQANSVTWGLMSILLVILQDPQRCLKIITQVSELDVGPNIIKKNPDIVQTVKRVKPKKNDYILN